MLKKYKYEIAFSVAEEDLHIAQNIAAFLRANNISYYLYSEHQHAHWGEDLMRISFEKYAKQSKCVLLIISNTYATKHWSDVERQVAQAVGKGGEGSILPLRLDDVSLDGLSKNIVYVKWNNDPDEIARQVEARVKAIRKKWRKKVLVYGAACLFLSLIFIFMVNFLATKKFEKKERQDAKEKDTTVQVMDPPAPAPQPGPADSVIPEHQAVDSSENEEKKRPPDNINPEGYYLSFSGDDASLKDAVMKKMNLWFRLMHWGPVKDSSAARVCMDCYVQVLAAIPGEDTVRTSCTCRLKIKNDETAQWEEKGAHTVKYSKNAISAADSIIQYLQVYLN